MSGLGTGSCGRCGHPVERDEDFCSDACEEQTRAEDEEATHQAGLGYDTYPGW